MKFILILSIFLSSELGWGQIKGLWVQPCQNVDGEFISSEMDLSAKKVQIRYWGYEDDRCQKKYIQFEMRMESFWGDEGQVDFQVQNVFYTPLTDEVRDSLNLIRFCGISTWQTNQAESVIDKNCDSVTHYQKNQEIFSIYRFEGQDQLFLGERDEIFDGSSEAKRHRKLQKIAYQKSNNSSHH